MQRTRYISSFLLMCTFTLGGNILLASTPLPTETTVYQQQKQFTVTGIIKDKTGEPIPGANVVVKGTTNGVVSDMDGNFSINISESPSTIQFSFMGFKTVEKAVRAEEKGLIIVLEEDAETLDEVVVVGFGTQKKASVVGSIQTVKPETLKVPSSSLSNSFAGRIAGVVAVQRSGEPGADGANFWIRGVSTFAGPTSPLIFIDGVEASTGDLNALSSEVIENFSVFERCNSHRFVWCTWCKRSHVGYNPKRP